MKLKDKDKNKDCKWQSFFFDQIRMHKQYSPHGDYDHMGEVINLVNDFKVDNVIFNCGEYNDLENELINVLDKKHIEYYSCIKELNIDEEIIYQKVSETFAMTDETLKSVIK